MNARRDTVKDWVVQQYREIVGDCDTARAGKQVDSDAQPDTRRPLHPPPHRSLSLAYLGRQLRVRCRGGIRATAAAGRRRQRDRDRDRRPHPAARVPVASGAVAVPLCAVDVSRYHAHKSTRMLESVVRQGVVGDVMRCPVLAVGGQREGEGSLGPVCRSRGSDATAARCRARDRGSGSRSRRGSRGGAVARPGHGVARSGRRTRRPSSRGCGVHVRGGGCCP